MGREWLATAYAGAGSQVEARTRAHCIPSSASFLAPWGLNRRSAVLPCCDPSIKLKTQGTLPIRKNSGSDGVFGFGVIREEDF